MFSADSGAVCGWKVILVFETKFHPTPEPESQDAKLANADYAFYQEDPNHGPQSKEYQARKEGAQRELTRLFRKIATQPNYESLMAQEKLAVLHLCPGNGAVTEALLAVLEAKGLREKAALTLVDLDPATQGTHQAAGLGELEFIVQDVQAFLNDAITAEKRFDLIVGTRVPGAVVKNVAEFLERSQQPYPYALMTTSSPDAYLEPNTDVFFDYLHVQEWVNDHPDSSTWISSEMHRVGHEIDKTYILSADPNGSLPKDSFEDLKEFQARIND